MISWSLKQYRLGFMALAVTLLAALAVSTPALLRRSNVYASARVLVIGDSIAMMEPTDGISGWGCHLQPFEVVLRPNARTTEHTLAHLDEWLAPADIILWNNGLHDLQKLHGPSAPPNVPLDTYVANLHRIGPRLLETGALVFWISITPVSEGCPQTWHINNSDITPYNAAAAAVMRELDIPIIDLNAFCREELSPNQILDDLHWKESASARHAEFIAERLKSEISIPQWLALTWFREPYTQTALPPAPDDASPSA